jgi:sulfite exporter TauE/SafE
MIAYLSDIGAGLLLGLLGSLHCVGMCGGIAGALQLTASGKYSPLTNTLLFNSGRILGYATMATLIAAALAAGFRGIPAVPQVLRTVAGAMLVLMGLLVMGLLPAGKLNPLVLLESLGGRLWRHIMPLQKKMLQNPAPLARIGVGFCWGWLPCGLVYSTLVWAIATHDPLTSAVRMTSFGVGTLPALISTGLLAARLQHQLRRQRTRRIGGAVLVLFGIWTMTAPWLHPLLHAGSHEHSVPASDSGHHH